MKNILIGFAVISSIVYGAFAFYKIGFKNKAHFTMECKGLKINKNKIYCFSNIERKFGVDTIQIHYNKAVFVAPLQGLGVLRFDSISKQFVFVLTNELRSTLYNPNENPLAPFCVNKVSEDCYRPLSTINENDLKEGLKFNVAGGGVGNTRVNIKIKEYKNSFFLETADQGIGCSYLLQSDSVSKVQILFNTNNNSDLVKNVFSFAELNTDTSNYIVNIYSSFNHLSYSIYKNAHLVNKAFTDKKIVIGDALFEFKERINLISILSILSLYFAIFIFQVLLFFNYKKKAKQNMIAAIIAVRILFNAIVFLSIPLFLHAFPADSKRIYFLFFTILLNISFYFSTDIFQAFFERIAAKKGFDIFTGLLLFVVAPLLFLFGIKNESLRLIPIPVLHLAKFCIVVLFYFLANTAFFNTIKNRNVKAILLFFIICGYSLCISLMSSDFSNVIFSTLSMLLILMIKDKRLLFLVLPFGVLFILAIKFDIKPSFNFFKDRKFYRVEAFVKQPLESLNCNEGDRQTVQNLLFSIKNFNETSFDNINNIKILQENRGTFFSDFSTHFSIVLGGYFFISIYSLVLLLMLYNLLFLLFCTIRPTRVKKEIAFVYPISKISGAIQFLLAFTIISYLFPFLSAFNAAPIVGISVPGLSISSVECAFFLILIFSLEAIFNTEKYYKQTKGQGYNLIDLKKSILSSLFLFGVFIVAILCVKFYTLRSYSDEVEWEKLHISASEVDAKITEIDAEDKEALINLAAELISKKAVVDIPNKIKGSLLDLTSLYYTNKKYSQITFDNPTYKNSTLRQFNRMNYDSLFAFKKEPINSTFSPFGTSVFGFYQNVNGKSEYNISNPLYSGYYPKSCIIPDLQAEVNFINQNHMTGMGIPENTSQLIVVDNSSGKIICNSIYPFTKSIEPVTPYFFIGSIKKILLAFCALKIDAQYFQKKYRGENGSLVSFSYFLSNSDNKYAESLLLDLLLHHKVSFEDILKNDFDLPLYSNQINGYSDVPITDFLTIMRLYKQGKIERLAIGFQQRYQFGTPVKWYARIAALRRLNPTSELFFKDTTSSTPIEYDIAAYSNLKTALNAVIMGGTAKDVGDELISLRLSNQLYGKTGTAEKNSTSNYSSCFVCFNQNYTFAISMEGDIPSNKSKETAKYLFCKLIPTLKKYNLLK